MKNQTLREAAQNVSLSPDATKVIANAINNYSGDFTVLESAIGAYILAHYLGHEPMSIIHSPVTLRKWAKILDIRWAEHFPAVGPVAERSTGYCWAQKIKAVKAAIHGDVSVPDRRTLTILE